MKFAKLLLCIATLGVLGDAQAVQIETLTFNMNFVGYTADSSGFLHPYGNPFSDTVMVSFPLIQSEQCYGFAPYGNGICLGSDGLSDGGSKITLGTHDDLLKTEYSKMLAALSIGVTSSYDMQDISYSSRRDYSSLNYTLPFITDFQTYIGQRSTSNTLDGLYLFDQRYWLGGDVRRNTGTTDAPNLDSLNGIITDINLNGKASWDGLPWRFDVQVSTALYRDGLPTLSLYNVDYQGFGTLSNIKIEGNTPVPEPAAIWLLGLGLICFQVCRRKRLLS